MSARPITVKPTTERLTSYSIVMDGAVRKLTSALDVLDSDITSLARARRERTSWRADYPNAIVRILRVRQTTVTEVVQ